MWKSHVLKEMIDVAANFGFVHLFFINSATIADVFEVGNTPWGDTGMKKTLTWRRQRDQEGEKGGTGDDIFGFRGRDDRPWETETEC